MQYKNQLRKEKLFLSLIVITFLILSSSISFAEDDQRFIKLRDKAIQEIRNTAELQIKAGENYNPLSIEGGETFKGNIGTKKEMYSKAITFLKYITENEKIPNAHNGKKSAEKRIEELKKIISELEKVEEDYNEKGVKEGNFLQKDTKYENEQFYTEERKTAEGVEEPSGSIFSKWWLWAIIILVFGGGSLSIFIIRRKKDPAQKDLDHTINLKIDKLLTLLLKIKEVINFENVDEKLFNDHLKIELNKIKSVRSLLLDDELNEEKYEYFEKKLKKYITPLVNSLENTGSITNDIKIIRGGTELIGKYAVTQLIIETRWLLERLNELLKHRYLSSLKTREGDLNKLTAKITLNQTETEAAINEINNKKESSSGGSDESPPQPLTDSDRTTETEPRLPISGQGKSRKKKDNNQTDLFE